MVTSKLAAIIGTPIGKSLINSHCILYADSLSELRYKLKELYKNTVWEEKPDTIAVCPIITEENGYQHFGPEKFRVSSKRFWAK